ncbi:Aste57867_9657 [Aphanomyces stellatus]|uniref:Aste57867_9657 protein n=1 Tax=Aphanomyces stellatus TaxID=120398 RepID=A0A485KNU5_9STRA|nr:hypothetical protein As57867_009619 [Aphanomyces stellatus]VFT86536.1 Aste57867_9657 [Aphanomyces stellatus]
MSPNDIKAEQLGTANEIQAEEESFSVNSVKAIVNTQVENASNVTAAARHNITKAAGMVWTTVKKPVTEAIQVIRDANSKAGTPLRKTIADVRLAANDTLISVEDSVKEAETSLEKTVAPVKDALQVAQENAIKFNTFRKAYPAVVVGGAALIVGLPTLLRGSKGRAVFNSIAAAGVAAGAIYGADEWEKLQQQH